ncbi:Dro/myosuppressin receptor [Fasciola hepatica]|uniref:Dro/myosuppressin receptor n=1 Tax=Fasciola hepatica TaxID=6192 RepID=A0A4E0RZ84_FASHE|nr:Dro/myosuppressin receptor [Fasciola hepatica]
MMLGQDWNRSVGTEYLLPLPSHADAIECTPFPPLEAFGHGYGKIHGYVALILCPLGVLSNIFNVIVLNQPSMISPINFLLTALAVSDGLLMTSYVPFAAYFLVGKHMTAASYDWCVFLLIHINLQNLLHSTSSNIVVVLASFRVLYVRYLIKCQELCSMRRAQIALMIVLIVSTLLTVPCAVSHHIILRDKDGGNPIDPNEAHMVTYIDNPLLIGYLYWNTAIFIKLLPLVALTILSLIIITTIKKRNAKMRRLKSPRVYSAIATDVITTASTNGRKISMPTKPETNAADQKVLSKVSNDARFAGDSVKRTPSVLSSRQSGCTPERDKAETRMTRLLLTVVLIFMITLLPQAILLFLNGFLGHCFTENVYNLLGDFTDLLTIMNNGINFVLYCSMSQQFRTTFFQLFCRWSDRAKQGHSSSLRRSTQQPRSFRLSSRR